METLASLAELQAPVQNILAEFESMAQMQATPETDKIKTIADIVNKELLPDLKETRDSSEQQVAANHEAVKVCNTNGGQSLQNIASSTETTVGQQRTTHGSCRGEEKTKEGTKDAKCGELDAFLNSVVVPADMPKSKPRDQMVKFTTTMSDYFCPKGPEVTDLNKACKEAEKEHSDQKTECDKDQATFESGFCTWNTQLNDACAILATCYEDAAKVYNDHVSETKNLIKKWKTEYAALKKIVCYTDVWLNDNDAKTVDADHLGKCSTDVVDTSPMDIHFPELPAKGVCDTSPVENHPGSPGFVTAEYAKFTGYVVSAIPCLSLSTSSSSESSTDTTLPIVPVGPTIHHEYSEVEALKFTGWNSDEGTKAGTHYIHGPFGKHDAIKKTLDNLPQHTRVKVAFRFWALDSWDREWAYFFADGKALWKKQRINPHHCEGWRNNNNNHLGYDVVDPWGGENKQDCYEDVEFTFAHTGGKLELKFDSSINQHKGDEAWAVEMINVKFITPQAIGRVYSEVELGNFQVWDNYGTNVGSHFLHGPFGTNNAIKKTLENLPAHTEVNVKFRYWALDSWDREWARFYADGQNRWQKQRTNPHHCHGWQNNNNNHLGYDVSDPWGGENKQDCYEDAEVTFAHTSDKIEVKFDSTINQHMHDEAWAVEMIVVNFIEAPQRAPQANQPAYR